MVRGSSTLLALCLLGLPATVSADTVLRVRIAAAVESVTLGGRGLVADRQPLRVPELRATAEGEAVRVGELHSTRPLDVHATGGLSVDGRLYPGTLSLVPRGGGRLDVLNLVELEAYVERAVASEVPASWPTEMLKAQAIVARTYALHERLRRREDVFDLESSVLSQRYLADPVPARARQAARATRGAYLSYGGEPILAAFHASSGGLTASSEEVWGEPRPYLRGVVSPDDEAPDYFWRYEIRASDLLAALTEAALTEAGAAEAGEAEAGEAPAQVRVLARSPSGRVQRLAIGGLVLDGRTLRQVLGGRAIRSTRFEVAERGDWVRFMGSGAGHGVGLCQWGARELASRGESADAILAHYYPGTRLLHYEARSAKENPSP